MYFVNYIHFSYTGPQEFSSEKFPGLHLRTNQSMIISEFHLGNNIKNSEATTRMVQSVGLLSNVPLSSDPLKKCLRPPL